MKIARELAEEKYELRYYDIKEENFFNILNAILKRENNEDNRIVGYYEVRKALIEKLESNGRWMHTPYGFINRSDYHFNVQQGEIAYTNNIISIFDNEYCILKPTEVSVAYFKEHEEDFKNLSNVEKLIARIYKMNKQEVDHLMSLTTTKKGLKEATSGTLKHLKLKLSAPVISYPKEAFINDEINNTKAFLERYQRDGIVRIINWLNRLNGEEDIDTLVDAFIEEFTELRNNTITTNNYEEMLLENYENKILKVISRYSIRGKKLAETYKEKLKEQIESKKKR